MGCTRYCDLHGSSTQHQQERAGGLGGCLKQLRFVVIALEEKRREEKKLPVVVW